VVLASSVGHLLSIDVLLICVRTEILKVLFFLIVRSVVEPKNLVHFLTHSNTHVDVLLEISQAGKSIVLLEQHIQN
jgi:predicted ester cyclase